MTQQKATMQTLCPFNKIFTSSSLFALMLMVGQRYDFASVIRLGAESLALLLMQFALFHFTPHF